MKFDVRSLRIAFLFFCVSVLFGYAPEWSPYIFRAISGNSIDVLGRTSQYRVDCSLSANKDGYCSDLFLIPVDWSRVDQNSMIGVGMLASDLVYGCYEKGEFEQRAIFGNPARPGYLTNHYREYRFLSLYGFQCAGMVAVATYVRYSDARHGYVAGSVVLGPSQSVLDYRKMIDLLNNQIPFAFGVLGMLLLWLIRFIRRISSRENDLTWLWVMSVYWIIGGFVSSGIIQSLLPFPSGNIFYRRVSTYFFFISEWIFCYFMVLEYPKAFANKLIRPVTTFLFVPVFPIKRPILVPLLSSLSIVMIAVFSTENWSIYYAKLGLASTVLIFILSIGTNSILFFFALIHVLSIVKMFNIEGFPQTFVTFFYLSLYVIKRGVDAVENETKEVIRGLIERSTHDKKFADQIIHDIRSPVGVLKMLISSVNWNDDQQEVKQMVLQSLGRVQSLSKDYMKSDSIRNEIGRSDFSNIQTLIDEVKARLSSSVSLDCSLEPLGESFLRIRQSIFDRVLQNLIVNSAEAKNVTCIRLEGRRFDNRYELSIHNDGDPIPAGVLSVILKQGGTYGKVEGTGLGIQFCKNEIEKATGVFTLASDAAGTRATVNLPLT